MEIKLNKNGVMFIEGATIQGLTRTGGIQIDAGEGGLVVYVDQESLKLIAHMAGMMLIRPDCSIPLSHQERDQKS